jgi:hypothetical protein
LISKPIIRIDAFMQIHPNQRRGRLSVSTLSGVMPLIILGKRKIRFSPEAVDL